LSEIETDDSEDDEAFLPVAASQIQGQFERTKTASPTASLRLVRFALSREKFRDSLSGQRRPLPRPRLGQSWLLWQ
jgi:hypothetical protein